jgi:large subunit ribosomal protein L35
MPKIKTNRTAYKKVRVTKNGKIKCAHANHSHHLGKKAAKRKRSLNKMTVTDDTNAPTLRRMLPYGGK